MTADLTDITIASTSGISSILQGGAAFGLESDHPPNSIPKPTTYV